MADAVSSREDRAAIGSSFKMVNQHVSSLHGQNLKCFGAMAECPSVLARAAGLSLFSRAGEMDMSDLTRREALRLTTTAGVLVAGVSAAAALDDKAPPGDDQAGQKSSGATALQRDVIECKIDFPNIRARNAEGSRGCFFGRMSPDPSPGRNVLTITGLPEGTRAISAWVTEWSEGDKPHAGGAFFYTISVQLYENGTKCRVVFNLDWGNHLPAGAQVMFC